MSRYHGAECTCRACLELFYNGLITRKSSESKDQNYVVVGCGSNEHPYIKVHVKNVHSAYEKCTGSCKFEPEFDLKCSRCQKKRFMDDILFYVFYACGFGFLLSLIFAIDKPMALLFTVGSLVIGLTSIFIAFNVTYYPCKKTVKEQKIKDTRRKITNLEAMLNVKDQLAELDRL